MRHKKADTKEMPVLSRQIEDPGQKIIIRPKREIAESGGVLLPAIVAAQAVTVVAAPMLAAALWWLTSREDVMGRDRNSLVTNICAGVGLALLLCMAWYTVIAKILPAIAMRSELAPLLG